MAHDDFLYIVIYKVCTTLLRRAVFQGVWRLLRGGELRGGAVTGECDAEGSSGEEVSGFGRFFLSDHRPASCRPVIAHPCFYLFFFLPASASPDV